MSKYIEQSYKLKPVITPEGDIISVIYGEDKKPCSPVCYGYVPTNKEAHRKEMEAVRKAQGKRATPELKASALAMIENGHSVGKVAARLRVSRATVYNWINSSELDS